MKHPFTKAQVKKAKLKYKRAKARPDFAEKKDAFIGYLVGKKIPNWGAIRLTASRD